MVALFLFLGTPLLSIFYYNSYVSLARFSVLDEELQGSVALNQTDIPVILWIEEADIQAIQKLITGNVFVQDFPVLKLSTTSEGVKALAQMQNVQKLQLDNLRAMTQAVDDSLNSMEEISFTATGNGSLVTVVQIDTVVRSGLHGYYTYKTFRKVNVDATVINLKGLEDDGTGSISQMLLALQEAVRLKPDLVCASVGSKGQPNDILSRTVNLMFTRFNTPSIWSAGNEGLDEIYTPANAKFAVASIALDDFGRRAGYSNFGSKDGRFMVSNLGHVNIEGKDVYGTSFSDPILCGHVAHRIADEKQSRGLNKSERLPAEEVAALIVNAAKDEDIGAFAWDDQTGYGHPTQSAIMRSKPSLGVQERLYTNPYSSLIWVNIAAFIGGISVLRYGRRLN